MHWNNIPGYDGKYKVNSDGQVRRVLGSGKTRMMTEYERKRAHGKVCVKLTLNGVSREVAVVRVMVDTYYGGYPKDCVAYHKDGIKSNNALSNIGLMRRHDLGKLTGAMSRRRPVAKVDKEGNVVEFYSSAREAARQNYLSYQTIMDRCNKNIKNPYTLDGYNYQWDM